MIWMIGDDCHSNWITAEISFHNFVTTILFAIIRWKIAVFAMLLRIVGPTMPPLRCSYNVPHFCRRTPWRSIDQQSHKFMIYNVVIDADNIRRVNFMQSHFWLTVSMEQSVVITMWSNRAVHGRHSINFSWSVIRIFQMYIRMELIESCKWNKIGSRSDEEIWLERTDSFEETQIIWLELNSNEETQNTWFELIHLEKLINWQSQFVVMNRL